MNALKKLCILIIFVCLVSNTAIAYAQQTPQQRECERLRQAYLTAKEQWKTAYDNTVRASAIYTREVNSLQTLQALEPLFILVGGDVYAQYLQLVIIQMGRVATAYQNLQAAQSTEDADRQAMDAAARAWRECLRR